VKSKAANIKLTPEDYELIAERAARAKISAAAWMRSILLQAANRPANNGYIRIHEPNGATV
jgi:predicted HicB family RNase H-like nuclease